MKRKFDTNYLGKTIIYLLLAFFLTACSHNSKRYVIGVSQCSSDVWRNKLNKELEASALCYDNVEVRFASADDNSGKQIKQIEKYVKDGVDLLIVSPNQASSVSPAVDEAYDQGIPVILFDRKTSSDKYTAFIGADNYKIGREMGAFISQLLGGHGRVVEITGLRESSPAIDRDHGFTDALKEHSGIHLAARAHGDWTEQSGSHAMDSILLATQDFDCVFGQNDRMAIGARKVIGNMGTRAKKNIQYVGIDALATPDGGLSLVRDGKLAASFMYPTRGDLVIKLAMDILHNRPYKKDNYMDAALVTDKNAGVMLIQNGEIESQQTRMKNLSGKLDQFLIQYSTQQVYLVLFIIIIILLIVFFLFAYRMLLMKRRMGERTAKAKLEFFTNVSHELRTPLTLIAGPVEQLADDAAMDKSQHAMLLMVRKNVNVMLRLVNEILDFRKVQNGKMTMQLCQFNLSDSLRQWVGMFLPLSKRKNIVLTMDIPDGISLYGDEGKIERVCYNLISNAIKYTQENGSVTVSATSDNDNVSIVVSDTGVGIPKDAVANVFDRFYRVGGDTQKGTGIGLAIVQSFTALHHGTVKVDSTEGKGSVFTVTLPLQQTTTNSNRQADEKTAEKSFVIDDYIPEDADKEINTDKITATETEEGKSRILVVDDNEDVRTFIVSLLKDTYDISLAKDGKEGMNKAVKEVPDLIVSDVMMPVMDGTEMCRRIKGETVTCHIPVILLTAQSMEDQRAEGYDCGADAYITKPFSSKVFMSRIHNLLDSRAKLKDLFGNGEHHEEAKAQSLDTKFIDKFKKIINEDITNSDLNVENVSAKMGMSRVQLYRKVKALTGATPVELIRTIRLKRAEHLLHTTESTVAEIAYQVGFSSPSYFARCFREHFGKLPNEMRENG